MKFRKGDKVKFLNEQGGGVVSKIINPNLVHVTIEDGFDIPVLPSELLKIEEDNPDSRGIIHESTEATPSRQANQPTMAGEENGENGMRSPLYYGKNAVSQGVYLGFSPTDQKFLISGEINLFIMNNTPYDVLYSFITKSGDKFVSKDYDTVFSEEKTLIESIDREQLPDYLEGYVQFLFVKEEFSEILLPVNAGFKVQGSKFYHENSFKKSQLLNEQAIMVTLTELAEVEKLTDKASLKKLTENHKQKPGKPQKPQALIDRHKSGTLEAEVDLHISGLREDFNEMSNSEILRYQLSYFETTLESALLHQYQKVIYIHGIGNGTLKNELRKKLKSEYPDLPVRNAPFTRYGNGAIEVLIQHE